MCRRVFLNFFMLLLSIGLTHYCLGQGGRGTINGTVVDQSGASVPGAHIVIRNLDTGQIREVIAGDNGQYNAPYLPIGRFSISADHPGFAATTQDGMTLTADQVATVNLSLSVGQTEEKVEVTANQLQINTTSATLSQVIDSTQINELPLNGRNPATLAFLVPGGTNGAGSGAIQIAGQGAGFPNETGASINGSRMGGIYYTLDGVYNMDSYLQTANPFPNPDATQEFRVLTNNFGAQYGFASNAVVSVVTKSGTNQWHGGVFEFARNDFFDAKDYFSGVKDGLTRNQFGGSLGGPIKKDKDFIFGNYQQTRESQVNNSSSSYVPNAKMLTGDFSDLLSGPSPVQLHDPQGNPYVNNQIPTGLFSNTALNIEKHISQTTNPTGLVYIAGLPTTDTYNEFTIRNDWSPNIRNHVTGRVFYDKYDQPAASGDNFLATSDGWPAENTNYVGTWTFIATPKLVNNFSFGYDRLNSSANSGINQSWSQLGANIQTADPNATIFVNWGGTGFSWFEQNIKQNRHDFDIADSLSITAGRHDIVAGVDVLNSYSLEQASWLADPLVLVNGSVTGSFFSDFLLGELNTFEQGGGEYNVVHSTEPDAFVQDTIHLKPNLTLSLGVRYEPWAAPKTDPDGRIVDFVAGQQSTVFPNAPAGMLFIGDKGIPDGGYSSEYANFSPRIGIAWQPPLLKNTSVRAAFGRFHVPYALTYYNHIGDNAPFSPTYNLTQSSVAPGTNLLLDDPYKNYTPTGGVSPFPPFSKSGFNPPSNVAFVTPVNVQAAFNPKFRLPWQQSWNLSIEHQFPAGILGTVAYVGSQAYHLAVPNDQNPGIYADGGARTTLPEFSSIELYESRGVSSYHALQISAQKNFAHNFQFISNYTWSKTLDEGSQSDLSSGQGQSDPFNLSHDYGISKLNVPFIWSNTLVAETPSFKGKNALIRYGLGSWELSGVGTVTAGSPFSVAGGNGSNNSKSQQNSDRADVTGQPFEVKQGSKSHWLQQYFNPAAFAINAPGTFGTSGRNLLRAPRRDNIDMMLAKNFRFGEVDNLQFRWEMFNATNTPAFGAPTADPSSSAEGQIVSTINSARIMQFGAKFNF
ncbi:Oar protein [Acidisarcina polymorpha]|uniref:Oar protein n=1 Tax=Acidisarcina polymorpha TaxID=2211140 RepID=A0A2Z5G979_9BACT|nr:carboxypeptidase regulatory-like domain-containing protein [Acidisarcina polymorpha]AXC15842.1 Oar protein [Acidisarcina polymorpha]